MLKTEQKPLAKTVELAKDIVGAIGTVIWDDDEVRDKKHTEEVKTVVDIIDPVLRKCHRLALCARQSSHHENIYRFLNELMQLLEYGEGNGDVKEG